MKVELKHQLGDGAFGDVWLGIDELDREVAVKFIRPAAEQISDAIDHAKALARSRHPNVVHVLSVEEMIDPSTGAASTAVVMDLLRGNTLDAVLKGTIWRIAYSLRDRGTGRLIQRGRCRLRRSCSADAAIPIDSNHLPRSPAEDERERLSIVLLDKPRSTVPSSWSPRMTLSTGGAEKTAYSSMKFRPA